MKERYDELRNRLAEIVDVRRARRACSWDQTGVDAARRLEGAGGAG